MSKLRNNVENIGVSTAAFYDKFPKFYNIFVVAPIAVFSGLMFGFDISSVSAFIGQPRYTSYFGNPSSLLQSGITSAMAGGSFIGSLASSYISDPLGRRLCLQICASFWIIGAAIQSSSQNVTQLIIGRYISGFGVGFGTSTAPTYLSEISPKKIRGTIGSFFQLAVALGILIMFYIGYGCSFINGTGSFRVAWGAQIVPGLIMFVGALFIPESPRWLANHGKWEEAKFVVEKVHRSIKLDEDVIQIELEEIQEQVLLDKEAAEFGYAELFTKSNLKRTFVGMSAQVWQQFCGMNVMMYYIVYIFDMAGYSGNANLVASSIQYCIMFGMTIPGLWIIDHFGRRPVLLIGGVFMMTWLFAQAGLLATYANHVDSVNGDDTVRLLIPNSRKPAAKAVIACSYLFVASFAPTWGVTIWLYCAELFPSRQRAKATAVTTSSNWICNWALAMFVPSSFKNITWKTYIIFGVFCFVLTAQTFFMFPETKEKTLEEIDQMWKNNIPAWRTAAYIPDMPVVGIEKMEKPVHEEHAATSDTGSDLLVKDRDQSISV